MDKQAIEKGSMNESLKLTIAMKTLNQIAYDIRAIDDSVKLKDAQNLAFHAIHKIHLGESCPEMNEYIHEG